MDSRHKTDQNCVIGDGGGKNMKKRKRKETDGEKKNGPMMGTFLNSKEGGGEEQGRRITKAGLFERTLRKNRTKISLSLKIKQQNVVNKTSEFFNVCLFMIMLYKAKRDLYMNGLKYIQSYSGYSKQQQQQQQKWWSLHLIPFLSHFLIM